jgi:hypothetical protein
MLGGMSRRTPIDTVLCETETWDVELSHNTDNVQTKMQDWESVPPSPHQKLLIHAGKELEDSGRWSD